MRVLLWGWGLEVFVVINEGERVNRGASWFLTYDKLCLGHFLQKIKIWTITE